MARLFTSDLHLDGGRPETTDLFLRFLREEARYAEALYILGDLFEAWVGDDDDDPHLEPIVAGLASLTAAGVPCWIMRGNRDFLLGRDFARATGCTLLDDYETIELYGERVLLTHGDLLCTDDVGYMEMRATVRDPAWQRDFLARPLSERKAIAEDLRRRSRTETAAKPEDIMDVNRRAVEETMRRFGVRCLLHGHTHRPAVHELTVAGEPAERIVLGAWHEHGHVLRWDERGRRVELL